MTDSIDTLTKRLEKLSAHVQRPPEQGSHSFNLELFNQEEQEALTALLREVIDAGSLSKLTDEQLDQLEKWYVLEQAREDARAAA